MNPSDCGSRGLLPSELLNHNLWWHGPEWLKLPTNAWPSPRITPNVELPDCRHSTKGIVTLSSTQPTELPIISWMKRFSSYNKLLRVVAVLLRMIYNYRNKLHQRTGPLNPADIDLAIICCIKLIQTNNLIPKNSNSIAESFSKLAPFLDKDGIWRVGGRIRHSEIPFNRKHPILLPAQSHFTTLLVDHYHQMFLHPGPSTLQAMIQTRFWIVPSLRRLVRKRTFMCLKCYKFNAKPIPPPMGDLPDYRVQKKHAFCHTGVDFAGPFVMRESLRRKAATSKIYLALYVCMETKALHLEAVSRLTTEAFLASFDRFTARRGLPSQMHSDCGLNFVGANNLLKEFYQWYTNPMTKTKIIEHGTQRGITWKFNPPYAPHFGGLWEAGVRSVKRLFLKSVGETPLSYEEYQTLFCRFEAILNSRPLCPLSTDPDECDFLSPGHFLVGGPLFAHPEPSLLDRKEHMLTRWQLVKRMSQQFWNRWSLEYLSTLQARTKWTKTSPNIESGTLVLVKGANTSVMSWPLGRILTTHPGKDSRVRVVTVQVGNSCFKRPVVDIVPLLPLSLPAFES